MNSEDHSAVASGLTPLVASRVPEPGPATPSGAYSRAQLAWLRFHADEPAPHQWAWLAADRRHARGPPETWVILRAKKRIGRFLLACSIRAGEMRALDRFFDSFPTVNAAGHALLKASHHAPDTREASKPKARATALKDLDHPLPTVGATPSGEES